MIFVEYKFKGDIEVADVEGKSPENIALLNKNFLKT